MKKQLLSAAVLLGLAGGATAVNLNENGLGQVLLYPYYNIVDGKDSLFTVVNTTSEYKAVKVRVNEGANTWEVLDYNVYLSPWDVYTFGLTMKGDTPSLISYDTSCTYPNDPDTFKAGVPFNPANINEFGASNEPKIFEGLDVVKRMQEGHIEVIEMGRVTNPTLQKGIKHVNNVPKDCSVLDTHFTANSGSALIPLGTGATNTKDEAPSGGLFGTGMIVDVARGSAYSYEAAAINDFYTDAVHTDSGESYPNVAGYSEAGVIAAQKSAQILRDGRIMNLEFDHPIQALGAVLMADKIYNTFDVFSGTESATDWVISFPTKHAHVNVDTTAAGGAAGHYGVLTEALKYNEMTKPFAGHCNAIGLVGTNREEERATSKAVFSPSVTSSQELCYETNVIQFNTDRKVFESVLSNEAGIKSSWTDGWASLEFKGNTLEATSATIVDSNGQLYATDTFVLQGLPVLGFAASEMRNVQNKDNSKGFYSSVFNHRYNRGYSYVDANGVRVLGSGNIGNSTITS